MKIPNLPIGRAWREYNVLLLLTIVFFSNPITLFSQGVEDNPTFECGHDHVLNNWLAIQPESKEKLREYEMNLSRQSEDIRISGSESSIRKSMPDDCYHIPVVFHVIHYPDEEVGVGSNLEYSRMLSQIDALNSSFSGGDGGEETGIRFCLAQNASEGSNWSSDSEPGVMRYSHTFAPTHSISAYNQEILLGVTHSDPEDFPFENYLNIWVVNSIGGVIGYSPLPILEELGTPLSDMDGVVIIGSAVGATEFGGEGMDPNFENGRILAHEVGHYLRLYHTFSTATNPDGVICGGMSDDDTSDNYCLDYGDYVCDTPPTDASTNFQYCSSTEGSNTCSEDVDYSIWGINPFLVFDGPNDAFDLEENYMNYTFESCMQTFTNGQAARMQAFIEDQRSNLVTWENLVNTGVASDNGCFGEYLSAYFDTDLHYACSGYDLSFDAIDGEMSLAVSWEWNFDDGNIETTSTPFINHVFNEPGTYEVTLTVEDSESNTDSYTFAIIITECADPDPHQSNWLFGQWIGFDFSSGVPILSDQIYDPHTMAAGAATICENDPNTGELIYYSNGVNIWNSNGVQINSSPISSNFTTTISPLSNYEYSTKTYLASIPTPNQAGSYRMFSYNSGSNNLVYSNVNTNTNIASDAIEVNLGDYNSINRMFVIPHCNGFDYWLVLTSGNDFLAYMVTENGLSNATFTQSEWNANLTPSLAGTSSEDLGNFVAEVFNDQLVFYRTTDSEQKFSFYDFDNATGEVSFSNDVVIPDSYFYYSSNGTSIFESDFDNTSGIRTFAITDNGNFIYMCGVKVIGSPGHGFNKVFRLDIANNEMWKFHNQIRETIVRGPETNGSKIYMMRRNRRWADAVHNPEAADIQEIEHQIEAIDYEPYPFMKNSNVLTRGSKPDFMDGEFLPEMLPDIFVNQQNCNTFEFSIQDCYSNWTQSWYYGDEQFDLNDNNPTHQYEMPGFYTVTLELSLAGDFVVAYEVPVQATGVFPEFVMDEPCIEFGTELTLESSDEFLNVEWEIDPAAGIFTETGTNVASGLPVNIEWFSEGSWEITVTAESEPDCIYTNTITVDAVCCATGETTIDGMEVTGGMTWAGESITWTDDLVVTSGSVVQIFNSEFFFDDDVKIEVEPGGVLFVFNSTFDRGCGATQWNGISLQGNPDEIQSVGIQAFGIFISSTITHSRNGLVASRISDWGSASSQLGGGMILASDVDFIDNARDVTIRKYENFPDVANYCNFTNCRFDLTESYDLITNPTRRVYLNRCHGVRFRKCQFTNSNPDLNDNHYTQAIYAYKGPFTIDCEDGYPDDCEDSKISGFYRGIYSSGTNTWPLQIKSTKFNCYRGAYINSPTLVEIVSNTFHALPTEFPATPGVMSDFDVYRSYGAYINGVGSFSVSQNDFGMGFNDEATGLIVRNNSPVSNTIHLNRFLSNVRGCKFYDNNRSTFPWWGLNYTCNIFRTNIQDVEINSNPNAEATATTGIRPWMGWFTNSFGNHYEQLTTIPDADDIGNYTENTHWHFWNTAANELHPEDVEGISLSAISTSQACEELFMMAPLEDLNDLNQAYLSKKLEYLLLVDEGETAELKETIIELDAEEYLPLFNELMSKSPKLSEEVMIESILKEDFPNAMLTIVLSNNPSAAKSLKIQKQLDNRVNSLEEYQREMIDGGLDELSSKEILEAHIGSISSDFSKMLVPQMTAFTLDSGDTKKMDKWDEIMKIESGLAGDYRRLSFNIARNSLMEVKSSIGEILNTISPNSAEYDDLIELKKVNDIAINFNPDNGLASGDIAYLESLLYTEHPFASTYALDMLFENNEDYKFYEPLDYPRIVKVKSAKEEDIDISNPAWLTLFPNPAKETLFLELKNAPIVSKANWQITNLQGQTVLNGSVDEISYLYNIEIGNLSSGYYTFQISEDGRSLARLKLIIE